MRLRSAVCAERANRHAKKAEHRTEQQESPIHRVIIRHGNWGRELGN